MAASVAVNVDEDAAPSDGFIFLRGKPVRFKKGLPVLDEECLRYTRSYNRTSAVAPFIMHGIGLAMAFAVYKLGDTALYDKQIALLKETNCGWLYLCVVVYSVLVMALNQYPMMHKHKIVHSADDRAAMAIKLLANLSGPNQQIYKQLSCQPNGKPTAEEAARGYIVVENEGPIGAFNRANRSMHNFIEYNPATAARIMCCAFLFPLPTFVTSVLLACGRVMHQARRIFAELLFSSNTQHISHQMMLMLASAISRQVGYADPVGFWSSTRLVGFLVFYTLLAEIPQLGFLLFGALKALDVI